MRRKLSKTDVNKHQKDELLVTKNLDEINSNLIVDQYKK